MLLSEDGTWLLLESQAPPADGIFQEAAVPITDPTAVKFANEQARVAADALARAYYLCDAARDRWDGLGGGQPAIDVMEADVRKAASAVVAAYQQCFLAEKIWFLGVNVTITNTADPVVDGSPTDGRPAATGAKVNAVMARAIELQNWLFSATQSFSDSARNNAGSFNTVLQASLNGPPTMSVSDAGNMMNRAGELRANYEAGGGANLNSLLALAVNVK
jgi:hypothetical protein